MAPKFYSEDKKHEVEVQMKQSLHLKWCNVVSIMIALSRKSQGYHITPIYTPANTQNLRILIQEVSVVPLVLALVFLSPLKYGL